MSESERVQCMVGRRLQWCEHSRACLAVGPEELPGLRCTNARDHVGLHACGGRTWGQPVDPEAAPPKREMANTAATIAMLLGLALPLDLHGRRRPW